MTIELSNLTFTEQDDIVPASGVEEIVNTGVANTLAGNDTITGTNIGFGYGFINSGDIITGDGKDIITGNGGSGIGIYTSGFSTINTGNGEDSIISQGKFFNVGRVFLGDGNDSIIAEADFIDALSNSNVIDTGDGNDIIISTGGIQNSNIINTGNGDDSIIPQQHFTNYTDVFLGDGNDILTGTGTGYGILNSGTINTGNGKDSITSQGMFVNTGRVFLGEGNDSIITNEGFESGSNSSGAWFLGEGDDYIKGFGSGNFYGGNGNDTLELTPGTYTVGIWGEGGESPIFTKGNQLMITSEFEKLKAGSIVYDFTSLTAGKIIVVA